MNHRVKPAPIQRPDVGRARSLADFVGTGTPGFRIEVEGDRAVKINGHSLGVSRFDGLVEAGAKPGTAAGIALSMMDGRATYFVVRGTERETPRDLYDIGTAMVDAVNATIDGPHEPLVFAVTKQVGDEGSHDRGLGFVVSYAPKS